MIDRGLNRRSLLSGAAALSLSAWLPHTVTVVAAQTPATPVANSPTPGWAELGLMQGFPPPPELTVTRANWGSEPYIRWAAQHARQLFPTTPVGPWNRDATDVRSGSTELGEIAIADDAGSRIDLDQALYLSQTDAFLVLKDGAIFDERYFNSMTAATPHILASQTKAIVGLIALDLAADGTIDLAQPAREWVPELAGSPLGDASLEQLLDMQAPLAFPDLDPVFGFFFAAGMLPVPPDYAGPRTIYDYLLAAQPAGAAGSAFQYANASTETIGWVLRRATNSSLADLLAKRIWEPIGAEFPGAFVLDPIGTEIASGGFVCTARDLVRFGEMVRTSGTIDGRQVVAPQAIALLEGGFAAAAPRSRELFAASSYEETAPGFTFRAGWWLPNDTGGSFEARGMFGQRLFVAPWAGVTILQFASQLGAIRYDRLMERLFQEIATRLAAV
jgi:CubicO group peptidase (beta-lactamase class C family)